MKILPIVNNINEALHEVMKGDYSSKYLSRHYKGVILNFSDEEELKKACTKYIERSDIAFALDKLYDIFGTDPYTVTIEDFVAHYGTEWGFGNYTIYKAKERVNMYDEIAGLVRFVKW